MAAVLAGGVAGGFARVALHGVTRRVASAQAHWIAEVATALALGALMALALLRAALEHDAAMGAAVSALTVYAALSAVIGFRRALPREANPRVAAAMHFAGAYLGMLVGFVAVVAAYRVMG